MGGIFVKSGFVVKPRYHNIELSYCFEIWLSYVHLSDENNEPLTLMIGLNVFISGAITLLGYFFFKILGVGFEIFIISIKGTQLQAILKVQFHTNRLENNHAKFQGC